MGEGDRPTPLTCSARGCQEPAVWSLLWNNPKLHTPERRKSWLACDVHRSTLSDFLSARRFLRSVEALPAMSPEPTAGTDPDESRQ
jgi:hypothetical protein